MRTMYILMAYWLFAVLFAYVIFSGNINPINGRKFSPIENILSHWVFMPFALPFALIFGAYKLCYKSIKKYKKRPRPVPKKLRRFLKADTVFDETNTSMPLAKYNAIYKTNYTLDQVYGKGYEASLREDERKDISSTWIEEDELPF